MQKPKSENSEIIQWKWWFNKFNNLTRYFMFLRLFLSISRVMQELIVQLHFVIVIAEADGVRAWRHKRITLLSLSWFHFFCVAIVYLFIGVVLELLKRMFVKFIDWFVVRYRGIKTRGMHTPRRHTLQFHYNRFLFWSRNRSGLLLMLGNVEIDIRGELSIFPGQLV